MGEWELIRHLVLAGGLLFLFAFATAYEAAVQALSVSRLQELLRERGLEADRFLREIIENERCFRVSVAILSALCVGCFLLFSGSVWVWPKLQQGGWAWLKPTLVLLTIQAMIRGISARTGDVTVERLVFSMARAAWFLTVPIRPLARLIFAGQRLLARSLGYTVETGKEELEEEVIAAVEDGEIAGVVEETEGKMIRSILEFADSDVADIFTPRTEMVTIDVQAPVSEAISLAIREGHSRLPVHEGNRDNIIGIFYVREALRYWGQPQEKIPPLRQMLRKPLFVPETKKVSELLREMQHGHLHMAIVLDEYGGTAGLVTIEDLLEEIVGEIRDEFDHEETLPALQTIDRNTVIADAHAHVSEVNKIWGVELIPEDADYDTVAGFVLDTLGHIPTPGESFTAGELRVSVLEADERRVERVRIERMLAQEES